MVLWRGRGEVYKKKYGIEFFSEAWGFKEKGVTSQFRHNNKKLWREHELFSLPPRLSLFPSLSLLLPGPPPPPGPPPLPSSPTLQVLEAALSVLRCLASFAPDCIDDFVGAEGPNLVIEAMSRHAEPASLQDSCVSLLWSVSLRLHYANGFASMGSFQLAIHRLSAPRYLREVALQHQLCGLLWSLSLTLPLRKPLSSVTWTKLTN